MLRAKYSSHCGPPRRRRKTSPQTSLDFSRLRRFIREPTTLVDLLPARGDKLQGELLSFLRKRPAGLNTSTTWVPKSSLPVTKSQDFMIQPQPQIKSVPGVTTDKRRHECINSNVTGPVHSPHRSQSFPVKWESEESRRIDHLAPRRPGSRLRPRQKTGLALGHPLRQSRHLLDSRQSAPAREHEHLREMQMAIW